MYCITKRDKLEILEIFLRNNCEVSMCTLVTNYHGNTPRGHKSNKIRAIMIALEEDLNKTIQVRFFKIPPNRYILYFCKGENDGGEPNRRSHTNGIRLWHERWRS